MPQFEHVTCLAGPVAEVFEFFCRPANWVQLARAGLPLRLIEGPGRLGLGSRLTWKGRRWGVAHRSVNEVSAFEPGALLVVQQIQGPFRRWTHTHRFEAGPGGTRLTDAID